MLNQYYGILHIHKRYINALLYLFNFADIPIRHVSSPINSSHFIGTIKPKAFIISFDGIFWLLTDLHVSQKFS